MATPPKTYLTPEEYLEIERKAEFKSEYYRGEMYAMAGAGRAHNLIVANLAREVGNQIRSRPCEAYSATCACWSRQMACIPIRIS